MYINVYGVWMSTRSLRFHGIINFSRKHNTLQSTVVIKELIPMEELPSRWEIELEFVQALSNLQYLNFLAQNKYLEDDKFLAYLKYLEYWREPQYAKFLVYPNCLHVLSLLQSENFRQQILRADVAGVLMNDMVNRWKEPQHTFAPTPLADKLNEASKEDEIQQGLNEATAN